MSRLHWCCSEREFHVRFVERISGYMRSREGLIKLDWEMSKCKLAFPQGLSRLRKN
jgi:hypothetical protein